MEASNKWMFRLGLVFLAVNLVLAVLLMERAGRNARTEWLPIIPAAGNPSLPAGSFGESVGQNAPALYADSWRLVKTEVSGGYRIETYQEFETDKSAGGRILFTKPLDHYQYLRYWVGGKSNDGTASGGLASGSGSSGGGPSDGGSSVSSPSGAGTESSGGPAAVNPAAASNAS